MQWYRAGADFINTDREKRRGKPERDSHALLRKGRRNSS